MAWSDYLVFVDESGDHGLEKIDPQYPVFVLLFCLVEKGTYASTLCTELQRFKYEFFGRDTVILHEYDIRKAYGPFSILQNASVRDRFMSGITTMLTAAPITLFASVIHKERLKGRYAAPANPYHLGMQFGLERLHHALRHLGQADRETFVICESRGRREDDELELEFRRVCDGRNFRRKILPFKIDFVPKSSNTAGLQLADLLARPIGRHVLNPAQPNRAFDTARSKLYQSNGRVDGWGLKIFPS